MTDEELALMSRVAKRLRAQVEWRLSMNTCRPVHLWTNVEKDMACVQALEALLKREGD